MEAPCPPKGGLRLDNLFLTISSLIEVDNCVTSRSRAPRVSLRDY